VGKIKDWLEREKWAVFLYRKGGFRLVLLSPKVRGLAEVQQHRANGVGTITEDTCLHVAAEAAEHVALFLTCHRSRKSPDTQSAVTGGELYSCKMGISQLYFVFLLVSRFWVCQAFLL